MGMRPVQLEVGEAGVKRKMARRDWQCHQRNARQLQADQFLQQLMRGHLRLTHELLPHLLQRHARAHGEDEVGALQQAGIMDLCREYAMALLVQRQRYGARLQTVLSTRRSVSFSMRKEVCGVSC